MQSRRLLWLLAAVALVGMSTHALAANFPDVTGTPYVNSFAYLSSKGLVQGYSDGTGRPNQFLNRAEAFKVLTLSDPTLSERVAFYKENVPPLPLFTDVKQGQWFIPYTEAAYEAQALKGYPDGSLRPGKLLTVEEAVVILMRTHGITDESQVAQLSNAIENRANQWFTSAINTAIAKNIVLREAVPLRLGAPITRGQYFEMVYRTMRLQETGQLAFQDGTGDVQQAAIAPVNPPAAVVNGDGGQIINEPQPARVINEPQPVSVADGSPDAAESYFAISMPRLGIEDLPVIHPADPFSHDGVLEPLAHGVGHLFSYPGSNGKIMIYGHSSGYAWDRSSYTKIFRRVNELEPGDQVFVTYNGKLHTYEVTFEQAIDANDTSPFNDNGSGEELILYTCWPPDSIAQRYLVHAKPVSSVAVQ